MNNEIILTPKSVVLGLDLAKNHGEATAYTEAVIQDGKLFAHYIVAKRTAK